MAAPGDGRAAAGAAAGAEGATAVNWFEGRCTLHDAAAVRTLRARRLALPSPPLVDPMVAAGGKKRGRSAQAPGLTMTVVVLLPEEAALAVEQGWIPAGQDGVVAELDVARFAVFRDLWLQGFWVSSGAKFGSDFLLYPGDPDAYHASHLVMVMQEPHVWGRDLVVWNRVANGAKKSLLLADALSQPGTVHYIALDWCGSPELLTP